MTTLIDGWTLTQRQLLRLRHQPGNLIAMLVMPAVFIVLFGFVFGSAIGVPGGGNYREYLLPGLFVMTTVPAMSSAMVDVAMDQKSGVMDRLRSMPTTRASVPLGRSGADGLTGTFVLAVMLVCGLAVGWRAHKGVGPTLAAIGLLLLFRYVMSWVGTFLGLAVSSIEVATSLAPLTFPISMLSNAFVPTDGMPSWLQAICDWNPISSTVAAARVLFGNPGAPGPDAAWPLAHPVTASLLWSALLLVIFVPLSVRRFARAGL
ncbi:ABC transporter permease [Streptomyces sp. NPDC050535]|uniref:ABC transporter permease n=1 Tax=Streptomyces sp. NPDC050535 TaxID=3365626 RepID=UPI0037A99760